MNNDKQIKKERIAGDIFIRCCNRLNQENYILESLNDRLQRHDPPDLIFYNENNKNNFLEVEELSLWDKADTESKIASEKNGIGIGRIRSNDGYLYFHQIIKQNILKKNYKCDILLINAYRNNWGFDFELKGIDEFLQNDLDIQNHFNKYYKEVWLLDGNKKIYKIY